MSNGDDEPEDATDAEEEADVPATPESEDAEPDDADEQEAPDPAEVAAEFETRLDEAEADIEEAETETERDEVEAELDDIERDLAAAEFPTPEDEVEEGEAVPDYRTDLEERLAGHREALAASRPPPIVTEFRRRLETVETEIEAAETREEYDAAEAELDDIERDLADADLPEPGLEAEEDDAGAADDAEAGEEDEAEAPDYREELETRLAVARAAVVVGRYRLRIEAVEAEVEEAETEADLDEIDAALDDIESDLTDADLPGADAEDAQPREEVESMLSDARDAVDERRGPYAEDVVADIDAARQQIESSEWTEQEGLGEVADVVDSFLAEFNDIMDTAVEAESDDLADLDAALAEAADAVEAADLHADHDAETIAALLDATDDLQSGLDASTTWSDLEIRVQLERQGFYDRITPENRKDFPPELAVIRVAEKENDPERILMALDRFESNFMEENILNALRRMGPPEAYDAMIQRAQKRDQEAIRVLGKIGDDRAVDTFLDFIEGDSNLPLQKVTLRALGEIGSPDATEAVAQRLAADDAGIRAVSARALGMIGDTRAVDPLADLLDDDEDGSARAAAAWALNQIGTEAALAAAAGHTGDRVYTVQAEARKAADALPADDPAADDDGDDDGGFDFETEESGDTEPEPEPDPDEDITEPDPEDEEREDEDGGSDEAAA